LDGLARDTSGSSEELVLDKNVEFVMVDGIFSVEDEFKQGCHLNLNSVGLKEIIPT